MTNYTWAANLTKLRRAEALCGKDANEEMILDAYRKMGGLVIGNGPMIKVDLEVEEALVEEAPVEEASVEEAPVEEALVEEAPVEEASVEEASVEEAPVEEAPKKKAKK